jgi:hypothetical protein
MNAPSLIPDFQGLISGMTENVVERLCFLVTQIITPFFYMAGNIKFNHGFYLVLAWLLACGTAFFDTVFYRFGLIQPTPLLVCVL